MSSAKSIQKVKRTPKDKMAPIKESMKALEGLKKAIVPSGKKGNFTKGDLTALKALATEKKVEKELGVSFVPKIKAFHDAVNTDHEKEAKKKLEKAIEKKEATLEKNMKKIEDQIEAAAQRKEARKLAAKEKKEQAKEAAEAKKAAKKAAKEAEQENKGVRRSYIAELLLGKPKSPSPAKPPAKKARKSKKVEGGSHTPSADYLNF